MSLSPISSFFHLFFPLPSFTTYPFPSPLFFSPALHYITPASQRIRLQPTLVSHIVPRPHTKGPPFPFPFSLFPFVCGVGVVRGMSLGCEWMCCGAGCGVVRVPFSLFFFSLFLNFPFPPFPLG